MNIYIYICGIGLQNCISFQVLNLMGLEFVGYFANLVKYVFCGVNFGMFKDVVDG
jgi:hypothetical protein